MSGHFRFRVVPGRVGLVIGSSNVGLFWVSGRLRSSQVGSDHFGFRVISCQIGLVIESYSVGSFRILNRIGLD
jgi:hypothetical protein